MATTWRPSAWPAGSACGWKVGRKSSTSDDQLRGDGQRDVLDGRQAADASLGDIELLKFINPVVRACPQDHRVINVGWDETQLGEAEARSRWVSTQPTRLRAPRIRDGQLFPGVDS